MIDFNCPHCYQELKISENSAGKIAPCPRCKKEITIPIIIKPKQNTASNALTAILIAIGGFFVLLIITILIYTSGGTRQPPLTSSTIDAAPNTPPAPIEFYPIEETQQENQQTKTIHEVINQFSDESKNDAIKALAKTMARTHIELSGINKITYLDAVTVPATNTIDCIVYGEVIDSNDLKIELEYYFTAAEGDKYFTPISLEIDQKPVADDPTCHYYAQKRSGYTLDPVNYLNELIALEYNTQEPTTQKY